MFEMRNYEVPFASYTDGWVPIRSPLSGRGAVAIDSTNSTLCWVGTNCFLGGEKMNETYFHVDTSERLCGCKSLLGQRVSVEVCHEIGSTTPFLFAHFASLTQSGSLH